MSFDPALASGLFSAFTWGVGSLLFGRLLRHAPAEIRATAPAANLFKNALACGLFCLLWACVGGALPEGARGAQTGWLLWSGVMGFAVGDSLYFAALPRCGVQAAAMVGQLNVPLAALLSWIFLGERLAAGTLLGMLVVLCGVTLVVLDAPADHGRRGIDPGLRRRGLAFAFACACSQATAVVSGHGGFEGVPIVPGTVVRMLGGIGGALLIGVLASGLRRALRRPDAMGEVRSLVRPLHVRAVGLPLVPAALSASVLGLLPFHLALRELPGGISAVLFATTPLFTLPLGHWFGERHGPRGWLGTVIGFAGVVWIVRTLDA